MLLYVDQKKQSIRTVWLTENFDRSGLFLASNVGTEKNVKEPAVSTAHVSLCRLSIKVNKSMDENKRTIHATRK